MRINGLNHRTQRTPRFRSGCLSRQWRGVARARALLGTVINEMVKKVEARDRGVSPR